ncbi:GNAT family N-acetyltransferase [Actinoplanes sp. NPDC051494]|uniref:GNAT family N-acetyltransferase n=1 Tax=Actinoplanes sp. NPDC051494 TaxID=3363907 RepID=UPI0037A50168
MIGSTESDQATAGWFEVMHAFATATGGGHSDTAAGGTRLFVTANDISLENGVFSPAAPDEREIAGLARRMPGFGWDFCLQVRGEPTPGVLRIAAEHKLGEREVLPLMVCPATDVRYADAPAAGVRISRADPVDGDRYAATMAAAFEAPRAVFGTLLESQLRATGCTGYLVERDGVAIGTGLGARTGDQVGVYNVGIRPEHRRRGLGRAVTERILRDGFADGATTAFLQSSDTAVTLYEAMGFHTVEHWTYLY